MTTFEPFCTSFEMIERGNENKDGLFFRISSSTMTCNLTVYYMGGGYKEHHTQEGNFPDVHTPSHSLQHKMNTLEQKIQGYRYDLNLK